MASVPVAADGRDHVSGQSGPPYEDYVTPHQTHSPAPVLPHLVRLGPDSQGQELVSQTDPEDGPRILFCKDPAQGGHHAGVGCRVTWAITQEKSVVLWKGRER